MNPLRTLLQAHAALMTSAAVFLILPAALFLLTPPFAPVVDVVAGPAVRPPMVWMPLEAPHEEPPSEPAGSRVAAVERVAPEPVDPVSPVRPSHDASPSGSVRVRPSAPPLAGAGGLASGAGTAGRDLRKSRRRKCDPNNPGIVQTGTDVWQVERKLVRYYASHFKALDDLGYAARHDGADGKAVGMRVSGVRCNDLYQAGIRSGDVIHTVNGKPVRSIVGAVLLYQRLRGKDDFVLEITRKGTRKVLRYRLV